MLRLILLLLVILGSSQVLAQIKHSEPPFSLTLSQALEWDKDSTLAEPRNVSQVPLAERIDPATNPLTKGLDVNAKVLLAPDGMNNFGNYISPQSQFNLYNFTNWAYIDSLNWFAGTADQTVNIPARPWVEAAHKNGVKVLGTVFLGIAQWGGSADTVERMLIQDKEGRFVLAHRLLSMAKYYGFDGWLINQETDLQVVKDDKGQVVKGKVDKKRGRELAKKMQSFMRYLTKISPQEIEIHWYDSMLMDGRVRWQNTLNEKNLPMFQASPDSPATADAMFVNYWWNEEMLIQGAALAIKKGRSPYDIYFGADLWPERRAQRAFSRYKWLEYIFPAGRQARSSLALFANNINFNFAGTDQQAAYSQYKENPEDVLRFYQTEQRLFAGNNLNIAVRDSNEWSGLGAHIAARSVVKALPFISYFNTGHGRIQMSKGKKIAGKDWHDMAEQDILPTWQFAQFNNGDKRVQVRYDFSDAYEGGSSLRVDVKAFTQNSVIVPLYKTAIRLPSNATIHSFAKLNNLPENKISILLEFEGGETEQSFLRKQKASESGWHSNKLDLAKHAGKQVTRISIEIEASDNSGYFLLGGLHIE
ncbi:endo-beta-N-acetylglucosaminidase [Agaribacter flavus]|uniref:Glycoside hydrolase n=1 Tax=Agaribacter flavus TaxID=1902781 RepID=A0ABV7FKE4_9ALTE